MPSPTILKCHGCRRPVGEGSKNDAVVHVNYADIHHAQQAQQTWENRENTIDCPGCGKPAILVNGISGRFHLDGSDNRPCAHQPNPMFRASTGADLLDIPDLARWQVHCDACNPHKANDGTYCNNCYWFDARRCHTWEQTANWTAHLIGEDWLEVTNWGEFLQSLEPAEA